MTLRTNGSATLAALSRDADAALRTLGLRSTFTLDDLHCRMEWLRGRPVRLIPTDLPVLAPHGAWIAAEAADYIFFDRSGGPLLTTQIIGHEYGHMVYDAAALATVTPLIAAPRPAGGAVRGATLAHAGYHPFRERRAEVFGTVVVQRVAPWSSQGGITRAGPPDLPARMMAALEGGRVRA